MSTLPKIDLPETKPMTTRQAEQFLLSMEILLKQAAQGLLGFRAIIAGPCDRAAFEKAYHTHIVENSLQVWLSPGEAADLWAAVKAVNEPRQCARRSR